MLVSESWHLRKTVSYITGRGADSDIRPGSVSCITGRGADSHIRPGSAVSQAVVQTQTSGLGRSVVSQVMV